MADVEVPEERLTPELHSKLCKKVAQLTKVIYHLNTRNEDNDAKLQQMQADYEAEIASLLEESTAKINAAKEESGGQQKKAIIAMEKQVAELEKTYAAGKIPGGFFKREGRLKENEILSARVMDRPLRPLFPKGYKKDTQVIATVMSSDKENALQQANTVDEIDFKPSLLNSLVFMMTTIMTMTTFAVNYRGRPFMTGLLENRGMIGAIAVVTFIIFYCALEVDPEVNELLEFVPFPGERFRMTFVKLLLGDIVGTFAVDRVSHLIFVRGNKN